MSAVSHDLDWYRAANKPKTGIDELGVAKDWAESHIEADHEVSTYLRGDVPDAKPEWKFTVEGPQRFARALPKEVWLLARSYAPGDHCKYRGAFAAIDIRHIVSAKELDKRMRRLERAVAKLNEAATALAAEPTPSLRERVWDAIRLW